MLLKYILMLTSLFSGNSKQSTLEFKLTDYVRKTIRSEGLVLCFKLLIGAVFASMIIFALIQLGFLLQTYLLQFEDRRIMETLMFSSIFAIGLGGLYFIFIKNVKLVSIETKVIDQEAQNLGDSLEKIALNFMDGFLQGLNKHEQQQKQRSSYEHGK